MCTGSPTWQVVEPLRVLGVGAVANKLAPAVARETGTSWADFVVQRLSNRNDLGELREQKQQQQKV